MKIIIRCDANKDIATGHMKRCLNIASELQKAAEVLFVVASEASTSYVEGSYRYIKLDNEYNEPNIETARMIDILMAEKPDLMLIDSYFVSTEYMACLRPFVKVAYIDDLYEKIWPADIIINYGIIADTYPYEKDYAGSRRLLGPKYMPINEVYRNVSKCNIRENAKNVLVVSGGSDENHVMLNTVKTIIAKGLMLHFTFICGAFNSDMLEMKNIAKNSENIDILETLPNLSEAISSSDIIVTAGGTTLYEMAILGCPGIVYKIADNQSENIKGFVDKKLAIYAGDVRNDFSYEELVDTIYKLSSDYELRKELSDREKSVIDADGAIRLAKAIIKEL